MSVGLTNGLVELAVDRENGTFALNGIAGYGRLVDGGDLGDSYNYSPPRQDSFVDTPREVVVRVDEAGPVRARVHITASYAWPDHVDGSSRRGWVSTWSTSRPTWNCGPTRPRYGSAPAS